MNGIIDTNIIIHFSKGEVKGEWLRQNLQSGRAQYGISSITEAELFSKSILSEEERLMIDECLQGFVIIPADSNIARWAALYRVKYKVGFGDSFIAATARTLDLPLWTYNTKDFEKISGIELRCPE